MPHKATQNYVMTGWSTVTLYSEQEMADALKITTAKLRRHITEGKIGLSFHGNPLNTFNKEYTFLKSIYNDNQKRWKCVQNGGHFLKFAGYLDQHSRKAKYKCRCGYEKYD